MFVAISPSVAKYIYSLRSEEKETGGYVEVRVFRGIGGDIIYFVKNFVESSNSRSIASAKIKSGSPFIWHLHPKGFGANPSSIDLGTMVRRAGFEALSLRGYPPLFIIISFMGEKKFEYAFTSNGGILFNVKGESLDIKCFSVLLDRSGFEIVEEGVEDIGEVDESEGVIMDSGPIAYQVIETILNSYKYPSSIVSILKSIRGIYSVGDSIDDIDLYRVMGIVNTLNRFGIHMDSVRVVKMGSRKRFSVFLKGRDLKFNVVELNRYFLSDEIVRHMLGDVNA